MNGPLLPLSDDELVLVSSAASGHVHEIVEAVRDWITQGHREAQNDRAYGTITVR